MTDTILQQAIDRKQLDSSPFYWYESIDSTNSKALELARNGSKSGTIVMAKSQTCGRGRLGRNWISPAGTGLYFSIILRPQLSPEHLSKITLAAGVAVSQAIDLLTNISSTIKWPNDVLANGKKVAGILSESSGITHNRETVVVLGIGINVTTPLDAFPKDLYDKVTSLLAVTGKTFQNGSLLKHIVHQVSLQTESLERGDFSKILEEWKKRDATIGKQLNWLNTNNKVVHGVSLGPDNNGHLKIRDSSGKVHEVVSGDLSLAS